jgi:hypothetical protein
MRFRYGKPKNTLCLLKYLTKKYKNDICIPLLNDTNHPITRHSDYSLRWDDKSQQLLIPRRFWVVIKQCKETSKRFIILPFGFECNGQSGHFNIILIDKELYEIERFEPYGIPKRKCANSNIVDIKLMELFTENLGKLYHYYKPNDILNTKVYGIQEKQENENEFNNSIDPPNGYCTLWCIWWVEMRISNKTFSREQFYNNINIPKKLTSYIRNYANKLTICNNS